MTRSFLWSTFLLPFLPAHAQTVQVVQTTADLKQALAKQPDVRFSDNPAPGDGMPVITVDDMARFQTMDGFGASLTDGAAWLLEDKLAPAQRRDVMEQLFDPARGIGLSFLRQPIGSSDLSRSESSFDDVPVGQQDPGLKHFSVAHDDAYIFPAVREALKLNPAITIMATPWSPPAWMKTEPTMDGGGLRDDAMGVYADYLVRSLEAFQKQGIPVRYLSVQNEPLHDTTDFPGTLMQAAQQKQFIGQYLGPALKHADLNTQVLAYDHNWNHIEYPEEELADPSAAPYLAGSALHCYGGVAAAQSTLHDRFPDKGIWLTECSGGTWQRESPLLVTAHLMLDTTRNWAKAVVLWGIALDTEHSPHSGGCDTCRGLVTVDLHVNPPTATYTGDFYGLGQASHFVRPGATRIDSTSPGRDSLESVAFQNRDRSIALVVVNNQAAAQRFHVRWHGHDFQVAVPGQAVATYLWQPDAAETHTAALVPEQGGR